MQLALHITVWALYLQIQPKADQKYLEEDYVHIEYV